MQKFHRCPPWMKNIIIFFFSSERLYVTFITRLTYPTYTSLIFFVQDMRSAALSIEYLIDMLIIRRKGDTN